MERKKHWFLFAILTSSFVFVSFLVWKHTNLRPLLLFKRMELVLVLYVFLSLHCFIEIKKIYHYLYKYRFWIFIGLFIFSVLNCFNGSSLGMYNYVIQPGDGSEYVNPVFGIPRAIRGDEWNVNVPRMLSAEYSHYGRYNDLVRATTSTNLVASGGLMLDYAALRDPSSWGYYLFGSSYGLSFQWSFKFIFGFAIWYELFLIITNKNKLLSLFGTCLVWFSTYNLWWSIVSQLISGAAIFVLFYYFIKEKNKLKRFLIGMCLAIAGADFACNLYPAWQVPMGFITLSLMVWVLIENNEWKDYKAIDWIIFVADVIFMLSIIARFIWMDMEYIEGISKTIYPGARVEYGGFSLNKLLGYLYVMFAFVIEQSNPCEMSCIAVVFPLGLILDIYILYKEKFRNSLLVCLSMPMILFLVYCSIGLPPILAKITLMTHSTPARAVDYLGVVLALITIVSINELDKEGKFSIKTSILVGLVTILPSLVYCLSLTDNTTFKKLIILLGILLFVLIILILSENKVVSARKYGMIFSSICLASTGMLVHPVMVGTDAILSKPVAKEIQKIVKNDSSAKWIALDSTILPEYLIACGAPTVNSINYYPNYDLWEILDPMKKYEEVWNRYAHVTISLSNNDQPAYELTVMDAIKLTVTSDELNKMNVSYILSQNKIPDSWKDCMLEVYSEDGIFIYQYIN